MDVQKQNYDQLNEESQKKMLRGSAWMTVGSFASRLLGAIYIIPWYLWMGQQAELANNLFTKGYNIYALFLMISTAGIPGAIAKQISKYNSLNEYNVSKELFKRTLMVMGMLGVVSSAFMFFGSPLLASLSGGNKDLIPVMKSLSVAVLIFPIMSAFRGFFQGNQDMMPSAISQVVEQIARVAYILVTAYVIMKIGSGDYVSAVTHATLAAFVGSLFALLLLLWFYKKYMPRLAELEANSRNEIEIKPNQLIKEIVMEAIPFIFIGSAITIFKLIDQMTFERFLGSYTNYTTEQVEKLFTLFSGNPDKLTMITISIATSLAVAGLPLITELYTKKKFKELAKQLSDNIQLFFFVMIPSTFGMILLSDELNTVFYRTDDLGASLLRQATYVGVILGFYILSSSILQGIYGNNKAIRFLVVGLLVKLICQFPFIYYLESYGPNLATAVGFLVASGLTIYEIYKMTHFAVGLTFRRTLLISILSLVMLLGAYLVQQLLYLFISPTTKGQAFIIVAVVGAVGGAIYTYLVLKLRLADKLLGSRMSGLRRKLNIR